MVFIQKLKDFLHDSLLIYQKDILFLMLILKNKNKKPSAIFYALIGIKPLTAYSAYNKPWDKSFVDSLFLENNFFIIIIIIL